MTTTLGYEVGAQAMKADQLEKVTDDGRRNGVDLSFARIEDEIIRLGYWNLNDVEAAHLTELADSLRDMAAKRAEPNP